MKTKELRELSPEELNKKLRDERESLLNLRLRKQTGQVEKTHEITLQRRDVARILTISREKKNAAAKA